MKKYLFFVLILCSPQLLATPAGLPPTSLTWSEQSNWYKTVNGVVDEKRFYATFYELFCQLSPLGHKRPILRVKKIYQVNIDRLIAEAIASNKFIVFPEGVGEILSPSDVNSIKLVLPPSELAEVDFYPDKDYLEIQEREEHRCSRTVITYWLVLKRSPQQTTSEKEKSAPGIELCRVRKEALEQTKARLINFTGETTVLRYDVSALTDRRITSENLNKVLRILRR